MPLITKNFRLNSLANLYADAVYAQLQENNGGDFFNVQSGQQTIQVNIIGGAPGIRLLVDTYYLEAIQQHYPNWEHLAILLLTKSLNGTELTKSGWEFWESMVNDMGSTIEGHAR